MLVRIADAAAGQRLGKWLACLPWNFEVQRLLGYILVHNSASHLVGNLSTILLTGPHIEAHLGTTQTAKLIAVVAAITGALNAVLLSTGLIGASGIAYCFAMLFPLIGGDKMWRRGEIPLSYCLLAMLWLGKELSLSVFASGGVSHFAHIVGAVAGFVYAAGGPSRALALLSA